AITVDSSGNIFAARWAVGIFKSTNGGVSWNSSGLAGKRIFSIATSPDGKIYAFATTTSTIEIFRSTDGGTTWTGVFSETRSNNSAFGGGFEFTHNGKIYAINSVTLGPTIGDVGAFMYLSTDNGISWSNRDLVGLTFNGVRQRGGLTKCLVLGSEGKLFAGTSDMTLLYTTNDGNNWLSAGIPVSAYVLGLTKDADGNIYTGLAGDGNNLFISTNNGASWEFTGLQLPFFDLIEDIHIINNNNTLYVATQFNIFKSTDAGITFDTINTGLPENASVLTLTNTSNGNLFGGTLANGVHTLGTPLGFMQNNSIPDAFILHQNHPNPFNPITKIRFSMLKAGNVRLTIYDASGREFQEIVNSDFNAGTHELNWDASSYSSGIYFYRIETDDFTATKKMILVK
ncbi:MAG: T9SS type A sorting domain-containing protein, partial [Ignavibacteria bacterium]|nr:T9SS type A sorting domain-containing protein [Ignavibacteria bacterium]